MTDEGAATAPMSMVDPEVVRRVRGARRILAQVRGIIGEMGEHLDELETLIVQIREGDDSGGTV